MTRFSRESVEKKAFSIDELNSGFNKVMKTGKKISC